MNEMTIICKECEKPLTIKDEKFLISKVDFVINELGGLCATCLEKHPEIKSKFQRA